LLFNQKIGGDVTSKYNIPYDNLNQFTRSISGQRLKTGQIYTNTRPLIVGYLSLFLWSAMGFVLSYLGLILKEKE
jgi:hypothetical protein